MLSKRRKSIFGGSYNYYITKDKKYFIKLCKGKEDFVSKEFSNLKKYWNKLGVDHFQLIEPVSFSKEKEYLITKFVKAKTLDQVLDPNIYYDFGKKLRIFHKNNFSHSHLEIQDVFYDNGNFILADVPFFNERKKIHDLDTVKLSINLYKLKRPWYWKKYKYCLTEFIRGYKFVNQNELEKEYIKSIHKRIRLYINMGKINKLRGHLLKLAYKIKLI